MRKVEGTILLDMIPRDFAHGKKGSPWRLVHDQQMEIDDSSDAMRLIPTSRQE